MAETAAAFGITERELVDDLNMLWCVELRSPDPYCPIDLSYEGGEIVVSEAEAMDRPLRLGVDEACALLIALRMLAELPSIGDGSALSRTIAKLEVAAGSAAGPERPGRGAGGRADQRVGGRPGRRRAQPPAPAAPVLLRAGPGRGDRARRRPDAPAGGRGPQLPGGLVPPGERRPVVPARPDSGRSRSWICLPRYPTSAEPVDVDSGLFRPSPQDVQVVLELSPAGRWVAEYYPCEQVEELPDGWLRIRLRTPDTQWVRRLALRLGRGRPSGRSRRSG